MSFEAWIAFCANEAVLCLTPGPAVLFVVSAALATDGCTFDWSWVMPNSAWMKRMGYDTAPIRPAVDSLRALGLHLSGVIEATQDGLERKVRLLGAPEAELYAKNVLEILEQEVGHARDHLREVGRTRKAHAT